MPIVRLLIKRGEGRGNRSSSTPMAPRNAPAKIILPPAVSSATATSSQSRPAPRMRALPMTQEDKNRARQHFGEAYHRAAAQVTAVAAADNKGQKPAVAALADALVSNVFVCSTFCSTD